MDMLDRLLAHDQWTTAWFQELSRGLNEAQLDQPFDLGHRTLRDTFAHMSGCVAFWTAAMTGEPIDEPSDDRSLEALVECHECTYTRFAAFARGLRDEGRLADTFPDPDDEDVRLTFGSTIQHVILHNAQHRSEALHMLERLGEPNLPEGNPLEWELRTQSS